MCNLQHVHFATHTLQHTHFATHALCNTRTLQQAHFATLAIWTRKDVLLVLNWPKVGYSRGFTCCQSKGTQEDVLLALNWPKVGYSCGFTCCQSKGTQEDVPCPPFHQSEASIFFDIHTYATHAQSHIMALLRTTKMESKTSYDPTLLLFASNIKGYRGQIKKLQKKTQSKLLLSVPMQ